MRQWAALLQPNRASTRPFSPAWTAGEQSASQRAGSSIRARAVRSRASPSGETCHRAWA